MGGCLTLQSQNKRNSLHESDIRHNTMIRARQSTFWENAAEFNQTKLDTDSDLNDTVQTWQSMNLYEMSTTVCARMTQSKLKRTGDVEPSVTEVQKDFDINSPLASETFTQQQIFTDCNCSRTNSAQDPQRSFELTHTATDLSNISDENLTTLVPSPKEDLTDDNVREPSRDDSEPTETEPPTEAKSASAISPVKMFDNTTKSYSAVDEFDEPALGKVKSLDSFDKLLTEPTVVKTLSGRWANEI